MLILKLTTWVPLTNSKNKGQADDSKVDTGAPSVSYMKANYRRTATHQRSAQEVSLSHD